MDLEFIAIDLQPLSVSVFATRPFLQIDLFCFVSINRLVTEWAERRWEGQREEKGGGGIEKVQRPNIFMCHHTIFELKCLSHTITAYWQQCIFKYTHVYRWNDCGHGQRLNIDNWFVCAWVNWLLQRVRGGEHTEVQWLNNYSSMMEECWKINLWAWAEKYAHKWHNTLCFFKWSKIKFIKSFGKVVSQILSWKKL